MESLADVVEQKFAQFNTVSPGHSLQDALYQMSFENLDYLVVEARGEFVGILSEKDVAHKAFTGNKPLEQLSVNDIMDSAVPVANATENVTFALQLMDCYNSRYIAVFDGMVFKGIVSQTDLLLHSMAGNAARHKASTIHGSFHWSY